LAEKRNDGLSGVTTNDGDGLARGVGVLNLRYESGRTNNVESGDTEEALWVVSALRLEDLSGDGDGGVDLEGVELARGPH